jgi:hypothetical protein
MSRCGYGETGPLLTPFRWIGSVLAGSAIYAAGRSNAIAAGRFDPAVAWP